MADFSKIGRQNKNRGRAFERKVAEKLGWQRVPYSGAIKEWGGADVVDGFFERRGYWAAECKTQQPGPEASISIKHKWVKQMLGAETNGRHGIIITKNVRSPNAWVFMLGDTMGWLQDFLGKKSADAIMFTKRIETFERGNGHNFVIKAEHLPGSGDGVLTVDVGDTIWHVMHLDDFEQLVKEYGIMTGAQRELFDK